MARIIRQVTDSLQPQESLQPSLAPGVSCSIIDYSSVSSSAISQHCKSIICVIQHFKPDILLVCLERTTAQTNCHWPLQPYIPHACILATGQVKIGSLIMQTGVAVSAKTTRRAASPTPQEKAGPTYCGPALYRNATEEATPSLVCGGYRVLISAGLHVT
jgi:hypothetical protein